MATRGRTPHKTDRKRAQSQSDDFECPAPKRPRFYKISGVNYQPAQSKTLKPTCSRQPNVAGYGQNVPSVFERLGPTAFHIPQSWNTGNIPVESASVWPPFPEYIPDPSPKRPCLTSYSETNDEPGYKPPRKNFKKGGRKGKGKCHHVEKEKTNLVPGSEAVDLCNPVQLEGLLKAKVGHQVSSFFRNPSFLKFLKSPSLDFKSVIVMMNLLENVVFCKLETLKRRVEKEVIPNLLEHRGFLDSVRFHLCSLPTGDQKRASAVSFLGHICKLFQVILDSGDVAPALVLPVDALWGTTRQLATQEVRFQTLHDKAKEILQMRDKIRQTLHDTSENMALQNDTIVLPTQKELEQKTLPVGLLGNVIKGPYFSALQYLDIQYRLLREDFIHPLRCAFNEIERDDSEVESHCMKIYEDVEIKSEAYSTFDGSTFEISFRAQDHHQIRWDRTKRFTYGDLVCLMNHDCSIILFATVAERSPSDLKRGILTIDFRTKVDIMSLPPTGYRMIESPGFYAAYAPVLRHLHELQEKPESLPFSRYIVECKTDVQLPKYISNDIEYILNLHTALCNRVHDDEECPFEAVNVLDEEMWTHIPTPSLDDSQKRALRSALTRELAVIQGPPGTGKTYIGLKIVETLLHNRASWDPTRSSSIVVVCYTNHALDQFLEGIIKQKGVTIDKNTQIRRVGGRSKSELMQEYNLNIFVRNYLHARKIFGFWRKKNSKIRQKIEALKDLLDCKFDPAKVKVYASFIGAEIRLLILNLFDFPFLSNASSQKVASWLGLDPQQTLAVDRYDPDEADRRIADEEDEENDIMKEFGREQLCLFFEQFAKVQPLTEERAMKIIAQLKDDAIVPFVRLQLFKYGLQSVKEELEEKLKMGKEREEIHVYEQQRRMAMIHCLQEADIIGLTTTGAAKHNNLLSQVDAKVIIIEEAAEILEAHTVSSLSQNTQHLILIGDHKQLRPKTNEYTLARNYSLDVSLFERLVKNDYPCDTLQVQHRMRPEISALVSSTIYQGKLIDAPLTREYPPVAGMKHNVFFIDHTEQESMDHDLKSPENDFEAHFLACLCRYLLQQCTYGEEQITVITPYTGQMYNLREKFREMNMTKVRITPIDSYQGEENDIILLSLVRSERTGFVRDENRICVAISRAKHGLYVIGNFSKLFKQKSKLWRSLVKHMETCGKVGSSLPLLCQGHQTLTEVGKPEDFELLVSDGGCSLQCCSRLPCNHMCPYKCHPDQELHFKIECEEPCPRYCSKGHRCTKRCHECNEGCGRCEEIVVRKIPKCGHQQPVPCYLDPQDFVCLEPCTEILRCGHKCKNTCGEPHTTECQELVEKKGPCGHTAREECYITEEQHSRRCKAPCGETLMCGHPCKGSCGECRQGRLHKPCQEKCTRILTCGHPCTSPCAQGCPPCKKQCPFKCSHGPCGHECWKPCRPCPHNCPRMCEHKTCKRTCGEPCNCKPCDEPCRKKLPCGHDCMGLCGEECPDICRICDKDTFNDKLPNIFGTEDVEDVELRIIMLDCGHKFDVKSLDKWMQTQDMSNQDKMICWKVCFLCKKPIFKTNRYTEITKNILSDLNTVKEKALLLTKNERRQYETELIEMVRKSRLLKHPDSFIKLLRAHSIPDKGLQAEYVIFCAEDRVTLATKDTHGEMDTDVVMQALNPTNRSEDFQELCQAMKTLKAQKDDFILKLDSYRRRHSFTEQVLHDVQAEQHRIQLLAMVLKVQSQIKTKNIHIQDSDQQWLDNFLTEYETRGDRVCRLKISSAEYESSMTYIQELKRRHPEITGISPKEKQMILRTLNAKPGSWYKCPNGHIYNIGECGGAVEESRCPECNARIGGSSHRLRSDNTHAREFDGSRHAAWSEGANMGNYDLQNLQ